MDDKKIKNNKQQEKHLSTEPSAQFDILQTKPKQKMLSIALIIQRSYIIFLI